MLRIHLLGALRLSYHDQALKFSALPKTLPLWAYLLLNREQALSRPLLAYTLWPDVNEAEARSNLRRHLYELRRVLPATPDTYPWLLADNSTVQWNPHAPYWLDVDEFVRLHMASQEQAASLASAVQIYTGDLLPEVDEEWIVFERDRLRNFFYDDLTHLFTYHRAQQEYRQAIIYAQQLLQHDPLREDVVRDLMTLRHTIGDSAGAIREYQIFEEHLRTELAVPPMPETSALYAALLHQTSLHQTSPLTAVSPPAGMHQHPCCPPHLHRPPSHQHPYPPNHVTIYRPN